MNINHYKRHFSFPCHPVQRRRELLLVKGRLVLSASSYLDLLDVRGCYSGSSIPGRDESGPRYISPYFNGYIGRFVTGKFKIHN